jgi:hypothetical protein
MDMTSIKLKITYVGGHNGGLDEDLRRAMAHMGYEMVGCGYNLNTKERDIEFDVPGSVPVLFEKAEKNAS